MTKKKVIVSWDHNIFDGESRQLPNRNKLYSQIYDLPHIGASWSVLFEFNPAPMDQGNESKATVRFLVESAPHYILSKGFKFHFYDGPRKIGYCEIVE